MHSPARLLALLLVVSGCAAHESEAEVALETESPGARRAALARAMGIELPAVARREAVGGDLSVWLSATGLAVVHADGRVVRLGALPPTPEVRPAPVRPPGSLPIRPRVEPKRPDPLIGALYDELEGRRTDAGLDVFVDRRVSSEMLGRVLYTASRASFDRFNLIGGSPEEPGAWTVSAVPFCELEPRILPAITELRADLKLAGAIGGLLATAELRPADRAPFSTGGLEEPPPTEDGAPPPEPRPFPFTVPLRLAGAGPQELLDTTRLAQLATAVCAMNQGPTGVELAPLETMTYEELLAVAAALELPPQCHHVPRMGFAGEPAEPAASGVAIGELKTYALAKLR